MIQIIIRNVDTWPLVEDFQVPFKRLASNGFQVDIRSLSIKVVLAVAKFAEFILAFLDFCECLGGKERK